MTTSWLGLRLLLVLSLLLASHAFPAYAGGEAGDYGDYYEEQSFYCTDNNNMDKTCYLCGKITESNEVKRQCCVSNGQVRSFCVDLLS